MRRMRRESALCKSINRINISELMLHSAKFIRRVLDNAEVAQLGRILSEIEQL